MEPPLSVRFETIADGIYVTCPELDIHCSGDDEGSALDQLAGMIADYWRVLLQDMDLRESSPHREHFEFFVQKVIPYIYEQEQAGEMNEEPAGFRKHIAGMICRAETNHPTA